MGADGDAALGGHELDSKDFTEPRDTARIDLAEGDRLGLEELAEHHLVKERGEEGGGGGGEGDTAYTQMYVSLLMIPTTTHGTWQRAAETKHYSTLYTQHSEQYIQYTAHRQLLSLSLSLSLPCSLPYLVVAHLPRGHANGCDGTCDLGVAQNVIGAGRLFDPPRVKLSEARHVLDGLPHLPALVRVHHQLCTRAERERQTGEGGERTHI